MKIILDNIIFTLQRSGGISVVWFELLSRLIRDGKKISCLSYSNRNIFIKKISFDKTINIQRNNFFIFFRRYCDLILRNEKERFIFHSSYYRITRNSKAINITTVHDFTYEYYCSGLSRIIHSWQKRRAILNSDYIICISESTKKDLLKFVPEVKEDKIRVIYNGVSEDYHVLSLRELATVQLPFPKQTYVVFVGSRVGYKNFELSVHAISKTTLNLVIVGAPLNRLELVLLQQNFKDMKRVYCANRISNQELNILYNNAFALLYPSLYEGFGIPVIEAQKAGCPVIAYNGSSIPEIIGDKTLLINSDLETEILKKYYCWKMLILV